MIILKMRDFLSSVGDTATSISHTITSGILRYPSISMSSAIGYLLLSLASLYLSLNRFSSTSVWTQQGVATGALLPLYFSAIMFLAGGAAGILMFVYLRKYKLDSEYLLHKGTPVEEEADTEANI